MSNRIVVALVIFALIGPAVGTETENVGVSILPAAGAVTIDGKVGDWDRVRHFLVARRNTLYYNDLSQ